MAPALALVVAAALSAAAANPLSVTVSGNTAAYSIKIMGWDLTLQGGSTGLMVNGGWASSQDGSLTPSVAPAFSGSDAWGPYNATSVLWALANKTVAMVTTFRVYVDVSAIAFETQFTQAFVTGSKGTSAQNDVTSSFPSWTVPASAPLNPTGTMQWLGAFIDDGSNGPLFSSWAPGFKLAAGLSGGPLVMFDETGQHTLIFSSLSSFMSTSSTLIDGEIRAGLLGSIATIPAYFTTTSVLYYGDAGINPTIMAWGADLLRYYGKPMDGPQMDYTNTHLIYNTDHGAYYYYLTEPGKDYLATLLDVNDYAKSVGIPYKGVLLDSWWYYKGAGTGVKNWTAMPSIFPGGNAGIRQLVETTGWKVVAHNRYWSNDNSYATQNGGNWSFYVDPAGEGNMAVPLQQAFWEWLLINAVKDWGLTTYEQDWLYNELGGVKVLLTDANMARQWLLQMNGGAAAAGVSIQYCMPYPRHVLQSVELSQVTQVRASDDHVPGDNYLQMQWRLGYSSLLAWAVALAPFKDNAWSTQHQPGGSCGKSNETSPALHQAISLLSAGPVTPGDGIGYSSPSLIMRSCTSGGRLLQPSRAATSIDGAILGRVWPSAPKAALAEIYATYSVVSGWVFDTILAAEVNASFTLQPAALLPTRADIPFRMPTVHLQPAPGPSVAYSVDATTFNPSTLVVKPFDDAANGVVLPPSKEPAFELWHTAPVMSNGWAVLGELAKWVPMSPARVQRIGMEGLQPYAVLTGEAGESVAFSFYNAAGAGTTVTATCVLSADGTATATVMGSGAGACT